MADGSKAERPQRRFRAQVDNELDEGDVCGVLMAEKPGFGQPNTAQANETMDVFSRRRGPYRRTLRALPKNI